MVILVILLILIIFMLVVIIKRRYGRRVTERQIINSQQIVNRAFKNVKETLEPYGISTSGGVTSELVANIWGHNVMAFEIVLPVRERADIKEITVTLARSLEKYGKEHDLRAYGMQYHALVVTDTWYDNRYSLIHFDIAHVVNEQTAAYLRDLARLNQPEF